MTQVYDLLTAIENHFNNNEPNINTVTFGDINKVDLTKLTLFPLAHFNIDDAEFKGSTIEFTVNLMCLDIVDEGEDWDGSFAGANNFQDVLNTQLQSINKLIDSLRGVRGYLAEAQYVVTNEPTAELLTDEDNNMINGWGVSIDIEVPNTISGCEV